MLRINFWSGLAVTALATALLVWVIPTHGGGGFSFGLPPQLVATIGAWIMLISAVTLVMVSIAQKVRSREPLLQGVDLSGIWHQTWPFLYVLLFICLAIYLPLTWIAPLLIGGLLFILGERRWLVYLLCTLTPTAGLYILTVYLMRIGVV
ncbi:hypothetical protein ADINL_1765 [Nitrincola lacisaponensis]|uniref:Uncharacterized protein n=1 Tax=Nitrincola lacisaponensis TaxID=267850 RepID=A0A063Y3I9_9GAMM|nr:hypothetical protein [Nitrincola lacisaponensis]KDE39725.1 hypothetical protein ADINL_1765 [Nitrincola lacisaponensis]